MTYPSPPRDGPRSPSSHRRCDQPSARRAPRARRGWRERREPEDRPASEPLRGCPVPKDQLAEGASPLRIALLEDGRRCAKPAFRDRDDHVIVAGERDRPPRLGCPRRDEDAGVRAVDEPDGDGAGRARRGPQLEARVSTGRDLVVDGDPAVRQRAARAAGLRLSGPAASSSLPWRRRVRRPSRRAGGRGSFARQGPPSTAAAHRRGSPTRR